MAVYITTLHVQISLKKLRFYRYNNDFTYHFQAVLLKLKIRLEITALLSNLFLRRLIIIFENKHLC